MHNATLLLYAIIRATFTIMRSEKQWKSSTEPLRQNSPGNGRINPRNGLSNLSDADISRCIVSVDSIPPANGQGNRHGRAGYWAFLISDLEKHAYRIVAGLSRGDAKRLQCAIGYHAKAYGKYFVTEYCSYRQELMIWRRL